MPRTVVAAVLDADFAVARDIVVKRCGIPPLVRADVGVRAGCGTVRKDVRSAVERSCGEVVPCVVRTTSLDQTQLSLTDVE